MRNLTLSLGCLILSSVCLAQQSQHHVYTFNGDSAGDGFGSVAGAGDVNQDGYPDLVVGARGDDNNGTDSGSARVLSGKDGRILYTFHGDSAGDRFGWSAAGAGDVNKDGFPDLIVGAPLDDNNGTDSGSARVLSGKDGRILYTFNGDSAGDGFGHSVAGAGDVNSDGYADLIVGALSDDNNGTNSGSARVLSGEWIERTSNKRTPKTKQILYTFNGDSAIDRFGHSVAGAGDVNRDGYADLIVGALLDDNNGTNSGSARVLSGKDGKILYTFYGDSAGDFFGNSVHGAGDVNKDGFPDLIVGANNDDNNGTDSGSVRVLSGRDGNVLYTFNGDSAFDRFGAVAGAGDVNRDGYADLIVGARGDDNNGTDSGSARVLSGRALALATDTHAFSLAKANTQNLTIDAGVANKGRNYWLFGSITGTRPGVRLASAVGTVTMPLQPDTYTDVTIAFANAGPFSKTRGVLDANGKATAQIKTGPLSSSLAGVVLYHSCLIYDAKGNFYMASNPATLIMAK